MSLLARTESLPLSSVIRVTEKRGRERGRGEGIIITNLFCMELVGILGPWVFLYLAAITSTNFSKFCLFYFFTKANIHRCLSVLHNNRLYRHKEEKIPSSFQVSKKKKSLSHFSQRPCTPPVDPWDRLCSQRLVWSTMSELDPRLSSAM